MAGVQPQPAQEWMATQLMAARNSSSIAASVDKSPRSIDYLDGDDDDDVDGDDEGDNGGDTTPGSLSTAATPFLPAPGEAASMPSFYAAMPVLGKDPLSSSKPLRVFDRTTFEAAFPQALANPAFVTSDISSSASVSNSADISFPSSTNSSASSIASSASIPASTPQSLDDLSKDPFFYPLLCANERRRLSEFWYLTSGIHDDRALATHLQSLLTIVKDLYDFDTAVIQLIDNDRSSSIDMNGWQETCCPRRETACAHTMLLQPGVSLSNHQNLYRLVS